MNKWLKVALIVSSLILILIGFLIGYLSVNKGCQENPFIYGIKEVNRINDDNYYCKCQSRKNYLNIFSFDEKEVKEGNFPF